MKRWLSFLLMLCLLVSLCACGGNAGGSDQDNGGNQGEQPGDEVHTQDTVVSQGLAYPVNADGKTCTIPGIGTCKDSNVVIPAVIDGYKVTSIGNGAFVACTSLTSIKIPDSVTSIGDDAFHYCSSLQSIEIPDGVISIDVAAFSGCSSLQSIEIPDSVTSIGDGAFYGCSSLQSIHFGGTKAQWEAISKGSSWNSGTGNYTVYCTDGEIAK